MRYIVDEEELEKLIYSCFQLGGISPNYDYIAELLHDKKPVKEIRVHALQGIPECGEVKLYISKDDFMKDLNFRKIFVMKAGEK